MHNSTICYISIYIMKIQGYLRHKDKVFYIMVDNLLQYYNNMDSMASGGLMKN